MNNRENSHIFLCVSPTMHLMKKACEHTGGQGGKSTESPTLEPELLPENILVSAPGSWHRASQTLMIS